MSKLIHHTTTNMSNKNEKSVVNRTVFQTPTGNWLAPASLPTIAAKSVVRVSTPAELKNLRFKAVDVEVVADSKEPKRAVVKKGDLHLVAPTKYPFDAAAAVAADQTLESLIALKFKVVDLVKIEVPAAAEPVAQVA
jgi:hypothetical protein